MARKPVTPANFDPDAAAPADSGIYGLPFSPDDSKVIILPVPFGAIRAYAERYPGMGILHLDAHADLRDAYEGFTWSHASIFNNVMTRIDDVGKLVQVGLRDVGLAENQMIRSSNGRIVAFFDPDLAARKDAGEP